MAKELCAPSQKNEAKEDEMNRRSLLDYVFIVVICAVIAGLAQILLPSRDHSSTTSNGATVFDRVVSKNTITCGYVPYPPGCIKDPNTGKLSGVFVDLLDEAGKNLGIKVVWSEEVGWGSMIEGLETDRYDLVGSPVWANSTRAKLADFSTPIFFSGICVFVKSGDERFTGALAKIDDTDVRIATIDGEMSDIIARGDFPKAKRISLPQLSDNSQMLLNVAEGKADVTFVEPYIADQFLKNSPGALKNITPERPIRIFPNTMMFRQGQARFKTMLDTALQELINSGRVEELLRKYRVTPDSFYLPAYPYRTHTSNQ